MSTKREIDLRDDWDLCFLPGQTVQMSMVFRCSEYPENTCLTCHTVCDTSVNGNDRYLQIVGFETFEEDINCQACGTIFDRGIVIVRARGLPRYEEDRYPLSHGPPVIPRSAVSIQRKRVELATEETRWFRRV